MRRGRSSRGNMRHLMQTFPLAREHTTGRCHAPGDRPMTRLTRWLLAGLAAAALSGCEGSDLTQPVAGSIRVTASTSGDSLDTDGYTVVLDGDSVQALGSGASVTLEEVGAGDHDLKLTSVAPN